MHKVYWIHEKHHTDPYTEGYVGYTGRDIGVRFEEHKVADSKVNEQIRGKDVVIDTLFESEHAQESLDYEFKLRPKWHIGWNESPGGFKGGAKPGRKTGWKHSKETKEKRSKALTGNTNGKNRARTIVIEGIEFRSNNDAYEYLSKKYGYSTMTAFKRIKDKKPLDTKYTCAGVTNPRAKKVIVDGITFDLKKQAIIYLQKTYSLSKNKAIEHLDKGTTINELQIKRRILK